MKIRFFHARILTMEEEREIFEGEVWVEDSRIIYVGNGKMVDARGTAYGVVYRDVPNNGAIVMIGRPD